MAKPDTTKAGKAIARVTAVKDVKMLGEFKSFIMRGNVLDLAVGIIIGVAFGAVIKSMVDDVIMPPIGLLLGGVDFKDSFIVLREGTATPGPYATLAAAQAAGAVTFRFGIFINTIINFVIVAFAVFLLVHGVGKMKAKADKKEAEAKVETEKECPECCMKIPIMARRCGHCTTELPRTKAATATG